MAGNINVKIEDVEKLKTTINKCWRGYKDVKKNVRDQIESSRKEWSDSKQEQFSEEFRKSEKDIDDLVKVMQQFENYLGKKISQLKDYHNVKLNIK